MFQSKYDIILKKQLYNIYQFSTWDKKFYFGNNLNSNKSITFKLTFQLKNIFKNF